MAGLAENIAPARHYLGGARKFALFEEEVYDGIVPLERERNEKDLFVTVSQKHNRTTVI